MKKRILFALAALFILFPSVPFAATMEWVARYDGPGSGADRAQAITVDGAGFVYVTGGGDPAGSLYDDYVTVKYDPAGTELWATRYDGAGSSDITNAIAVDGSGNVCVTGYSWDIHTDCATVMYDSTGTELWSARHDWWGFGDEGWGVALDGLGNAYVTGNCEQEPGNNYDVLTIKYDSSGNETWVRRYNGPSSEWDTGIDIALDDMNNVHVTGYCWGVHADFVTIQYDSTGNELWVERYSGPGNDDDQSRSIALDDAGNVYVTGWSFGGGTDFDYATIKYDSAGNEQWVSRYNGPDNKADRAWSVALDDAGSVYVTGWSDSADSLYDCTTVKYDSFGNEQWARRYNGPGNGYDQGGDIAVDSSGNVYVIASSQGIGTDYDYVIIQYSPSGDELWTDRYDGPGSGPDQNGALAVDASDNVYVTGQSMGSGTDFDYATIKYNQSGTPTLINDKIRALSGSDGCKGHPEDPVDPCDPDLAPGYPRFTVNPGTDDDLYEDYITIQSISAASIPMPIRTILKTLTPVAVRADNTDGGGDRPSTGYWDFSLSGNDGTTSDDDILDLDERIARIWQFVDEGGATFTFWVDVYSGYAKGGSGLGGFGFSPGSHSRDEGKVGAGKDYAHDEVSAVVYTGSTSGAFILANRFAAPAPVALHTVSFYTSGWAVGDEVDVIIYEDPTGAAPGLEPSMEVWRKTVELGSGNFQEVPADCPTLNPGGVPGASFFVAVANTADRSYTLGIDLSEPYAAASYVSTDGGSTFEPLSSMPVIEGNVMIRSAGEPPAPCFVGGVM